MKPCVFCSLVNGALECAKIWEDNDHIAILDIYPTMKGQALLITKTHTESDLNNMGDTEYQLFFLTARKVTSILKQGLSVGRIAMVVEGMGINHAHIKLYPLPGVGSDFQEMWGDKQIFFEKYEGYITTQLGPAVDMTELKNLAKEIRSKTYTQKL